MKWYWGSFVTGYRPLDNYGGDSYLKEVARSILAEAIEQWLESAYADHETLGDNRSI